MLNKILFVMALGFFVGLGSANADTTSAPGARIKGRITVARVQGHVEAISKIDGQRRPLHDGDSVTEQTEIVTSAASNVILVFSNGATVNVAADSTLDIEQFDQDPFSSELRVSTMTAEPGTSTTRLNLTKGELVGKVVHLNVDKGSEFTVQTPVGAAGIRGTTFRISFRPGPNGTAFYSVTTTEGRVVYTGITASPLDVPSGKQAAAIFDIKSGVASAPVVLSNVPPLDAAAIEAAAEAIEAAVVNLIFEPSGNNGPNGNGKGGPSGSPDNAPPPPAIPAPATTPGAGGP
jgi:hypothetical protein